MPRSGPSAADQELTTRLAGDGLAVSPAQLERWRAAGLLPRNTRHGRGRGQGSVSTTGPETAAAAAALARHARQGRDLRLAVLDWFAEAGRNEPGVPEPPDAAVCAAVQWATATSTPCRLLQLARAARTDQQVDNFYAAAGAAVARVAAVGPLDTTAVREAFLTGQDPGEGFGTRPGEVRAGLVQFIAATGLGFDEVGADALTEAATSTGMYSTMSAQDWDRALAKLGQLRDSGNPLAEQLLFSYDPLAMAQRADADMLRRSRRVTHELMAFGALYFMHALLMPDTPGLAALRALIHQMGIGQALMAMSLGGHRTRNFNDNLVSCLHPIYQVIHHLLSTQATTGPPLWPSGEDAAQKYMAGWLDTIKKAGSPQLAGG
jgi:hypothetical protein